MRQQIDYGWRSTFAGSQGDMDLRQFISQSDLKVVHLRLNPIVHFEAFATILAFASLCFLAADTRSQPAEVVAVHDQQRVGLGQPILLSQAATTSPATPTSSPPVTSTNRALPDLSWVPPEDGFDWIQLKSGEWLKGRLKAVQERKLEFDSDELGDLTFDWRDIRQLRSPRILDVLLEDGRRLSGPVEITPDEVRIGRPSPQVEKRARMQSLTPGGTREWNYWSGKVSLGLTVRAGNREQVEFNARTHLQRRTPATRLSLDYIGNLSSVEGIENAHNHRVDTEFDVWLSRRLYLIVPFFEYYRDPFQNLAYRLTAGAGLGYDLIDRPGLEWNVTTGPAYQYSKFESSQPDEPTEKGAAALVFGTRFDWDITSRTELILEYRGQYTSRKIGETAHHGVATLSLELTRVLDLDVSLVWDRISRPKADSSGETPKPDDFRLVVGLGLDF